MNRKLILGTVQFQKEGKVDRIEFSLYKLWELCLLLNEKIICQ